MALCKGYLNCLPIFFPRLTYTFASPSRILSLPRFSPSVSRFKICCAYSEFKFKEITQPKESELANTWNIKMLYDGECPLCMREVNMLRERNQAYGTIKFVDISSENYLPDENQGLDYKTVMGKIHAIESNGTIYTNVEAFRRLYEEVGLGWIYTITKYEPITTITNLIYKIWATYRLQLTGRPPLEKILGSKINVTHRAPLPSAPVSRALSATSAQPAPLIHGRDPCICSSAQLGDTDGDGGLATPSPVSSLAVQASQLAESLPQPQISHATLTRNSSLVPILKHDVCTWSRPFPSRQRAYSLLAFPVVSIHRVLIHYMWQECCGREKVNSDCIYYINRAIEEGTLL